MPTGSPPSTPARPGNPPDTSYSLREANVELTDIGRGLRNRDITDPSAKQFADSQLYGQVSREMEGGVARRGGEEASGAFASCALASGSVASGGLVDVLASQGTVAAGTAATKSTLVGGVYNSSPITLTNTPGAALQLDANGYDRFTSAPAGA